MDIRLIQMAICLAAFAMSAMAQTNVTNNNDGTASTVPVYTGSATLGNSPISVSGGNVGIGTSSPAAPLEVHSLTGNPGEITLNLSAPGGTSGRSSLIQANGRAIVGYEGYSFDGSTFVARVYISDAAASKDIAFSTGATNDNIRMIIKSGGNIGIGTTNPGAALELNGNMKLTANSGAGITFQDGTTQNTAYTGTTCGGDYAESMDATGERTNYAPGDVLVLDSDNPGKILKSLEPYSTAVAGIYSTKPGTVGRRQLTPRGGTEVPMAMLGVVPTKVTAENGAIHVGDLLVSSSQPGYAMKGTDRSRMLGAVIGKAMGTLDSGTGAIEVLVTLQ